MMNETTHPRSNRFDADVNRAQTTDQVVTKVHDTVDRLAETARSAEHQLRSRAAELGEQVREQEKRALHAIEANLDKLKIHTKQKPLLVVSMAFVAGLVISGLLIRR